jgi:hypothetical protein
MIILLLFVRKTCQLWRHNILSCFDGRRAYFADSSIYVSAVSIHLFHMTRKHIQSSQDKSRVIQSYHRPFRAFDVKKRSSRYRCQTCL